MEHHIKNIVTCLPQDPRAATKHLLDKILNDIHPLVIKIRNQSHSWSEDEERTSKIRDVYTLCLSQIKKCVLNLFEVFRLEFNNHMLLQESRQCNLERLSWCIKRLISIDNYLKKTALDNSKCEDESRDDSFNVTIMYFVNWIDHAFEVLGKLAEAVYKTDYKENESLYEKWKCDMVECVSGLHLSIDELLLSAMTLYRYCLPNDQLIVKARCQVVLRETKALLSELVEGDLSTTTKSTDALKLPVMPTNIDVMIDVLKDVLYALETNTNTALLTLLVHCFSNSISPVEVLKRHFMEGSKEMCKCMEGETSDVDDCQFVKDFDMYNERLLQIGSFAVSCSSDQHRILALRSGLASLESLDPQLVPALMTSPGSCHAALLVGSWQREVNEIRDSVFLIVDPAAFADKSKQMMHQKLLDTLKMTSYNNASVCAVINIGSVVFDFFAVYNEVEPLALCHREKLTPLLVDLDKAIAECKVVSNILCAGDDFVYDVNTPSHKEATLDKLYKRLKLLYTLVFKINTLHQPKDQLFDDEAPQNLTHTIVKNARVSDQTYLKSQQKANLSRSLFARSQVRSSTRNFALSKLAKHLRSKNCSQLNFSVEVDKLFNLSGENDGVLKNKLVMRARETSVLYNLSPIKNRSSMRKMVLNRHLSAVDKVANDNVDIGDQKSLMDEIESLQLTEILNQMNDTTSILINTKRGLETQTVPNDTKNILNITNQKSKNATVTKYSDSKNIWHIPMKTGEYGAINESILTSSMSNISQPSNVTTMERINDLELLETKLNSLKSQFETSL